jgi:hypothetical protein
MGISDEDYAKAIRQAAKKLTINEGTLEQAIQNASTFTLNTANYPSTASITQSGSKVLVEADLNSEAMKAPLSALVDMWTMRWQGEWVSEDAFQEDDFWRLALIRLVGANKLEKHNLASQYASVYRIID